jgi:hypothetical protein
MAAMEAMAMMAPVMAMLATRESFTGGSDHGTADGDDGDSGSEKLAGLAGLDV